MENYHVLEIIGEGSFGKVYKGRKKFSAQVVALKFIPKLGKSEKELKGLRREIDIMKGLKHDNIIELLDSFDTDKEVVVVTDCAEGELFQILEDDNSLPEEQVQVIAAQLVSALFYLHSHRILHRDMKPQNILLGKSGVIKLCDFGFARGMSTNTLVLTSIKGTPLYMSPELVEEKPYDHTADLWALGCILYELFAGTPPFYTNSIFQLVNMIIKDPVKWPKTMSSIFKDFLQGLLNKNPRHRLAWPQLLRHPFVTEFVRVNEEDTKLPSPFTQPLTASMMELKEEQTKTKANPPGASKILARARRKAQEDVEKKRLKQGGMQAWDHADGTNTEGGVVKDKCPSEDWAESVNSKKQPAVENMEPTPRPDRISKDYKNEYPSIEVEGRTVLNKKKKEKEEKVNNMENVNLDGEEGDSEDEMQRLIDLTDQEGDPDFTLQLLDDMEAVSKLHSRLLSSSKQVKECMLEGASRLRSILRIVTNIVTLKCEVKKIASFCNVVEMPKILLDLLKDVVKDGKIKEQPWAQQIMIDLVITLNAYFASEISWFDWSQVEAKEKLTLAQYRRAVHDFLDLVPVLVDDPTDEDLRLLEQTFLCVIYLSEVSERGRVEDPDSYYSSLAGQHKSAVDAILKSTMGDPNVLKRLTEIAEGNVQDATDRMEQMILQAIACLASMTFIPIETEKCKTGKRKVAAYLAEKLTNRKDRLTDEFLILMRHPMHCSSVLKVVYACCQASTEFCSFLNQQPEHTESLLGIVMGKIDSESLEFLQEAMSRSETRQSDATPRQDLSDCEEIKGQGDLQLARLVLLKGVEIADMEVNTVVELVLYILSVIVIQNQVMPDPLSDSAALMVGLFLDSTLASHTAAAALLFSQMVTCGVNAEVQPFEMLQACLAVFTDLDQICVHPPFDYGVLDGLLMLLCELLCGEHSEEIASKAESPVASLYIESGIWGAMWHRIAQGAQVISAGSNDMPVHDIEVEVSMDEGSNVKASQKFRIPEWALISPQGLMASLQMAVTVFTKETYQCLPNLATSDSILMLTLVHFLHPRFLESTLKHYQEEGPSLVEDIILAVTQMGCFPFAVDISEDLLAEIQHCLYSSQLLPRLVLACVNHLEGSSLETPLGLITRLVLGNVIYVEQFATAVKGCKAIPFFHKCIASDTHLSVVCDIISICSHLVRTSPEHLSLVKEIFKGPQGDFATLNTFIHHSTPAVKSRTCSLLGNMMRHDGQMYPVLKQRENVMSGLIRCLKDSDSNVRKCAAYAMGNACYHSGELYPIIKKALPLLIDLLHDPVTKTKANAASACGNLGMHSPVLLPDVKKCKLVAHLLETSCHDAQPVVQVNAILALRSLCQLEDVKKDLTSLHAVDKLTPLLTSQSANHDLITPRPYTPASSRPGSVMSNRPGTAISSRQNVSTCASKLLRLLQT